jgi:hypothetical protein
MTDEQDWSTRSAARTLVVDTMTVAVLRAFRTASLPSLILRGPILARLLYDPPESRSYADVDLLVEPRRFDEAEAILRQLGYAESHLESALPSSRPRHAHTWQASSGRSVDLHRTLLGVGAPAEALWSAFTSDARQIELGGMIVDVPSLAAVALIVALHAAHHVNDPEQTHRDLELALTRLPEDQWSAAVDLARRLDALPAFAKGLSLSPRGRSNLAALGLPISSEIGGFAGAGEPVFHVAHAISRVTSAQGLQARVSIAGRRLFPAPSAMRARSRLARRGAGGLILAYAVRLLTAARWLPAAVRVVQRARR